MTIEQITALVNAGFTKEEILALQNSEPVIPPTPEPEPEKAPEPEPTPEPQIAQEQAHAQLQQMAQKLTQEPAQPEISLADVLKSNQEVMENITKLTAAIQANAIRTAIQPAQTNNYSPEDALAEIIAPPPVERKV